LATVRIYKVAELLGTTSQEVSALLKRDHGIEVKSASSTIEEVVARQFVDRLARQRNIALPTGDIFAETPPPKGGAKKGAPAKKAAEPQKPAGPLLPPPRLVKTVKPAIAAAPPEEEPAPEAEPPAAVEEPSSPPPSLAVSESIADVAPAEATMHAAPVAEPELSEPSA
jgi:translation initiation factor IF-2